jgi:opacity protein-like surface antigen
MKKLVLASVAALTASPALSADLTTQQPPATTPVVTEFDWTGAFVGANFGWEWNHSSFDTYNTLNGVYASSGSINGTGPLGGAQAGYLYMLPSRFVFGGSAAVDWNGSTSTTTAANGNNAYTDKTSIGISGNVVGRAGYAFGDIFPYVFGGWAWQNVTYSQTQILGGALPGLNEQASTVRNGWVLGPGLAYRFWKNWEVFGEYQYQDFGALPINYPVMQRTNHTGLKINVISVGLNYKF